VQPLLPWKSSKCYIFGVFDCSLSYPACKSYAPCYSVTCGLSDSSLLGHITVSHHHHHHVQKGGLGVLPVNPPGFAFYYYREILIPCDSDALCFANIPSVM
jgi:hypothetical protein